MKVYNKKGLAWGVFWTVLGLFSLYRDFVDPDSFWLQQGKSVVISAVMVLIGITGFVRAFSKSATREDRIEELDERNRLVKLKYKARTFDIMFWITMAVMLLSLLASPLLRSAFRASPEALAMGAPALRIIALSFFFAGTSIIFCSAFQSLGRSRWSLLVALLRQILLLLPAAALLLALKPALVWAAFPLSELISCFAAALLYRRTIQKQLL